VSTHKRDTLNELLDAFLIGDGCATLLAYVVIVVAFVVCVFSLWVLFTTPSPLPLKWDQSLATQIPGNQGDTPTPLPSELSLPW